MKVFDIIFTLTMIGSGVACVDLKHYAWATLLLSIAFLNKIENIGKEQNMSLKDVWEVLDDELETMRDEMLAGAKEGMRNAVIKYKQELIDTVKEEIDKHFNEQPYYIECSECGEEMDLRNNDIDSNGDYTITVEPHTCEMDEEEEGIPQKGMGDVDEPEEEKPPLEERMEHPGVDEILQGERPDPLAFGE